MSDKEISGIIENQATLKGKIYEGQYELKGKIYEGRMNTK